MQTSRTARIARTSISVSNGGVSDNIGVAAAVLDGPRDAWRAARPRRFAQQIGFGGYRRVIVMVV